MRKKFDFMGLFVLVVIALMITSTLLGAENVLTLEIPGCSIRYEGKLSSEGSLVNEKSSLNEELPTESLHISEE